VSRPVLAGFLKSLADLEASYWSKTRGCDESGLWVRAPVVHIPRSEDLLIVLTIPY
jgi:hypothetical protein